MFTSFDPQRHFLPNILLKDQRFKDVNEAVRNATEEGFNFGGNIKIFFQKVVI